MCDCANRASLGFTITLGLGGVGPRCAGRSKTQTTELAMKNRFARLCAVILPITLINGCGIGRSFMDEGMVAQQWELFNQLCDAKERSIVNQTVNANGYLSAGNLRSCRLESHAWEPILKYGYDYHECTDARVTGHHLPGNADIYRFTLEPKGSPLCGVGDKHYYYYQDDTGAKLGELGWAHYFMEKHKAQLEGKCLVVKKVDKPMSRYIELHEYVYIDEGKEYYEDAIDNKYGGNHSAVRRKQGMITAGRTSIIDMDTGQYLSQYNYYSFFPKSMVYVTSHTVQCDRDVSPIKPNTVLIPGKSQK